MDEHWKSTGKINSGDFKNFLRCLIIVKSIIKDRRETLKLTFKNYTKHDKSLIERIEISDSFDLRNLPSIRRRERENVSFDSKLNWENNKLITLFRHTSISNIAVELCNLLWEFRWKSRALRRVECDNLFPIYNEKFNSSPSLNFNLSFFFLSILPLQISCYKRHSEFPLTFQRYHNNLSLFTSRYPLI